MSFWVDSGYSSGQEQLQLKRDRDLRVRLMQVYGLFAAVVLVAVVFLAMVARDQLAADVQAADLRLAHSVASQLTSADSALAQISQ